MSSYTVATDDLYKLIDEDKYIKTNEVWEFKHGSKCIVKAWEIDSMGVHHVIAPTFSYTPIMERERTALLHIVNIGGRTNMSVSKEAIAI